MHANLLGALQQLDKSYKAFEHRGRKMQKEEVKKILLWGIAKGYKNTSEFTDEEVDNLLNIKST
jgi:hypothetical protein